MLATWAGTWFFFEPSWATLATLLLFVIPIVAAAGLLWRRSWARWVSLVVAVFWAGSAAVLASDMEGGWRFMMVFLGGMYAPTLLLWLPPVGRHFQGDSTPADHESGKRWARPIVLLIGGVYLLSFVSDEAGDAKRAVQRYQQQQKCDETGDENACANAAMLAARTATTVAEVRNAMTQFRKVCDDHGNGLACTWWAHIHGSRTLGALWDGAEILRTDRRRKLRKACKSGDSRACWAWSVLGEEVRKPPDADQKCTSGDAYACELLAQTADEGPLGAGARERACKAGWRRFCDELQLDDRSRCWRGVTKACAAAAESAQGAERDAYLVMASRTSAANVGFVGVAPETDSGFTDACSSGSAPACFVAGLWLVREEGKQWRNSLPPVAELDATFGRACELGMDAACLAYATRLLDMPNPKDQKIERANTVAQAACDRGDRASCWVRDYGPEIVTGDYEALRQSAKRTCMLGGEPYEAQSCQTLANLLAHELEASFTPMDDRVYFHLLRDICQSSQHPAACRRITQMIYDGGIGAGLRTVAYHGAAVSCAQSDWWGCDELRRLPEFFPDGAPATKEELRESIREKQGIELDP